MLLLLVGNPFDTTLPPWNLFLFLSSPRQLPWFLYLPVSLPFADQYEWYCNVHYRGGTLSILVTRAANLLFEARLNNATQKLYE